MFEYFDIHSHLYFPDYDKDREDEISRLKEAKTGTITIGVDFETSEKAIDLAEKNENLFACVGQHPDDLKTDSVFDPRLESLIQNNKVVAIGECGLDYFKLFDKEGHTPRADYLKNVQKNIFQTQIDLSIKTGKPLMLHIRPTKYSLDAYEDTLDILEHYEKTAGSKLRGNAHFFAGNMDILRRFLDIGFSVSFTGVITFSRDYDEFVRYLPSDMIMAETDAPFVAPVPYRGQRNSSLYVIEVVNKIAEIRGESFESMKNILTENVIKHFPAIRGIAS